MDCKRLYLVAKGFYLCYVSTCKELKSAYTVENFMPAVKLSVEVVEKARISSKAFNRSIAGQIEYWAKIGRIAEENPDLSYEFIKTILVSLQQIEEGQTESYIFEKNRGLKEIAG